MAGWEIVRSHDVDEEELFDVISIYEDNDEEELICTRNIKKGDNREKIEENFRRLSSVNEVEDLLKDECAECDLDADMPFLDRWCKECNIRKALLLLSGR